MRGDHILLTFSWSKRPQRRLLQLCKFNKETKALSTGIRLEIEHPTTRISSSIVIAKKKGLYGLMITADCRYLVAKCCNEKIVQLTGWRRMNLPRNVLPSSSVTSNDYQFSYDAATHQLIIRSPPPSQNSEAEYSRSSDSMYFTGGTQLVWNILL